MNMRQMTSGEYQLNLEKKDQNALATVKVKSTKSNYVNDQLAR